MAARRPNPAARLNALVERATALACAARHPSLRHQANRVLLDLLETQERLQLRAFEDVPPEARGVFDTQLAGADVRLDVIEDLLARWGPNAIWPE
jgi:hypothetical protein